jgi:Cu2+-exporting ATPase
MTTNTYEIKGMSCTHCTARVTKALEADPDIKKAEVSLSPPQATITMEKPVSTDRLQELLRSAGGYQIHEMVKR